MSYFASLGSIINQVSNIVLDEVDKVLEIGDNDSDNNDNNKEVEEDDENEKDEEAYDLNKDRDQDNILLGDSNYIVNDNDVYTEINLDNSEVSFDNITNNHNHTIEEPLILHSIKSAEKSLDSQEISNIMLPDIDPILEPTHTNNNSHITYPHKQLFLDSPNTSQRPITYSPDISPIYTAPQTTQLHTHDDTILQLSKHINDNLLVQESQSKILEMEAMIDRLINDNSNLENKIITKNKELQSLSLKNQQLQQDLLDQSNLPLASRPNAPNGSITCTTTNTTAVHTSDIPSSASSSNDQTIVRLRQEHDEAIAALHIENERALQALESRLNDQWTALQSQLIYEKNLEITQLQQKCESLEREVEESKRLIQELNSRPSIDTNTVSSDTLSTLQLELTEARNHALDYKDRLEALEEAVWKTKAENAELIEAHEHETKRSRGYGDKAVSLQAELEQSRAQVAELNKTIQAQEGTIGELTSRLQIAPIAVQTPQSDSSALLADLERELTVALSSMQTHGPSSLPTAFASPRMAIGFSDSSPTTLDSIKHLISQITTQGARHVNNEQDITSILTFLQALSKELLGMGILGSGHGKLGLRSPADDEAWSERKAAVVGAISSFHWKNVCDQLSEAFHACQVCHSVYHTTCRRVLYIYVSVFIPCMYI